MTIKTQDEFDTPQAYVEYLSQIQAEKNAQSEIDMLIREGN